MRPWLWSFAVFSILRFFAWLFFAIVNDLIFAYNILMVLFWIVALFGCAWSWSVVYSLYWELSGLSKLEDLAQLRVSWSDCPKGISYHSKLKSLSIFFLLLTADGHNGIGARINESIVGRIASNYAIHHIHHSLNRGWRKIKTIKSNYLKTNNNFPLNI